MNRTASSAPLPPLESFDQLIALASAEPDPARLLTVLVKAEVAYRRHRDTAEPMVDEGCLVPVMVRDWPVTASLSLAEITKTADAVESSWQFLMTAVMPGRFGQPPSSAACEPHLERMARALMIGEGLQDFVFFDRSGEPISIHKAIS